MLDVLDDIVAAKPPEIPDTWMYPFTEEGIEMYLLGVYTGSITTDSLSLSYHERVGTTLERGMLIGLNQGNPNINFTSPEYELFRKFRTNIFQFSAAKQYQQVRTMSAFIVDKGVQSTFREFRELAGKVFDEYNKNYLKTEYNTAIGQAQMGREWVEAERKKELLPWLTYRTQRDSRVRDEHAILDGVTKRVDDPFWNTFMPKNGWNCRCYTFQKKRGKETDLSQLDLSDLQDEKKFPPTFRMNPGKDGLIFNPKEHPYFFVARGDAGLKANSFNLPIP